MSTSRAIVAEAKKRILQTNLAASTIPNLNADNQTPSDSKGHKNSYIEMEGGSVKANYFGSPMKAEN